MLQGDCRAWLAADVRVEMLDLFGPDQQKLIKQATSITIAVEFRQNSCYQAIMKQCLHEVFDQQKLCDQI